MDTERIRAALERLRWGRHEDSGFRHQDQQAVLDALDALLAFAPLLEVVERLEASEADWNVTLGRSRGKHTAEYEQSGVNGQWGHGSEVEAATWQEALAALVAQMPRNRA